jgi:hypothetical protein
VWTWKDEKKPRSCKEKDVRVLIVSMGAFEKGTRYETNARGARDVDP